MIYEMSLLYTTYRNKNYVDKTHERKGKTIMQKLTIAQKRNDGISKYWTTSNGHYQNSKKQFIKTIKEHYNT